MQELNQPDPAKLVTKPCKSSNSYPMYSAQPWTNISMSIHHVQGWTSLGIVTHFQGWMQLQLSAPHFQGCQTWATKSDQQPIDAPHDAKSNKRPMINTTSAWPYLTRTQESCLSIDNHTNTPSAKKHGNDRLPTNWAAWHRESGTSKEPTPSSSYPKAKFQSTRK